MNNAIMFIVGTLFDVVCFLFLARLILQASRADFYNPISQGVVKATDPVLKPLRLVIPGWKNFDASALLSAWLVKILALAILSALGSGFLPPVPQLLAVALFEVLRLLLSVYFFAIIIVVVLSFIAPGGYHPVAALMYQVTEPVMAPARRIIPPLGGLDFSPILVIMVIVLLRDHVLPAMLGAIFA